MARKSEPAKPGTQGRLHIDATVDGERVEAFGDYRYVGKLANGMLAFTPAPAPAPIFVHPTEVVAFRPEA
jgi:hypothetical protein